MFLHFRKCIKKIIKIIVDPRPLYRKRPLIIFFYFYTLRSPLGLVYVAGILYAVIMTFVIKNT